jgi:hypothetical protein
MKTVILKRELKAVAVDIMMVSSHSSIHNTPAHEKVIQKCIMIQREKFSYFDLIIQVPLGQIEKSDLEKWL